MDRRLEQWATEVAADLNITDAIDDSTIAKVLEMTKDVAQGVDRPAAPVTAYLLGVAVGRGAEPNQIFGPVCEMARNWEPEDGDISADEVE